MKNTKYKVYFGSYTIDVYAINRQSAIVKAMNEKIQRGEGFNVTHIQSEYDMKPQSVTVDFNFNN